MSKNGERATALATQIKQMRAEREACNLDAEDRRIKARRLSARIRDMETELRAVVCGQEA